MHININKLAPIIIAFQFMVVLLAKGRLERHVTKKRLLGQKAHRPAVLVCRALGWLNVATALTLGSWWVNRTWRRFTIALLGGAWLAVSAWQVNSQEPKGLENALAKNQPKETQAPSSKRSRPLLPRRYPSSR